MKLKLINNNTINPIVSLAFKTYKGPMLIFKNYDKFIGIGTLLYYEDLNSNKINIDLYGILKIENNLCTFGNL